MTEEIKQYRVWNIINPPDDPEFITVKDPEEGKTVIENLAELQLSDEDIEGNVFGLEVFEDGEWSEWYDEDGVDVLGNL